MQRRRQVWEIRAFNDIPWAFKELNFRQKWIEKIFHTAHAYTKCVFLLNPESHSLKKKQTGFLDMSLCHFRLIMINEPIIEMKLKGEIFNSSMHVKFYILLDIEVIEA